MEVAVDLLVPGIPEPGQHGGAYPVGLLPVPVSGFWGDMLGAGMQGAALDGQCEKVEAIDLFPEIKALCANVPGHVVQVCAYGGEQLGSGGVYQYPSGRQERDGGQGAQSRACCVIVIRKYMI